MGTVWITGAAGFTGLHLVRHLAQLAERPRIVGLDLADRAVAGLDESHQIDLARQEEVSALAGQCPPDWVIHLAGAMPPASEADMWRVNVGCTVSLLQGLAAAGCRQARFVGIGSAAEYGPGPGALSESSPCGGGSAYGRTKWIQTLVTLNLARDLGLAAMIARPFNLIGPGLPERLVAGALVRQFARAEADSEIAVGNTASARDFIDIRDAVAAYWLVACRGKAGEVYNVCTGEAHSVEELLALMAEVSGRSPRIRIDPSRIRPSDPPISYGSNDKLKALTGWRPRFSLRDSIAGMFESCSQG